MASVLRPILHSIHGRLFGLDKDNSLIAKGMPDQVAITPAVGATNVTLVTLQIKDNEGNNFNQVLPMLVWLSDVSNGNGLTATTASGTVGAGTKGTTLGSLTASKALKVLTSTDGSYILSITDTGKTNFYVCAMAENQMKPAPQIKQLATANYGP